MGDDSGFDAIIGNPPWEQTKIERDEFWGRNYPGLRGMTKNDREVKMAELEQERPDLVEELETERNAQRRRSEILTNGPYPDMGRGDPDLYQGFSWRFWRLTSESGHVGVVLPRAAFISPGAETLRYSILNEGNITDTTFLKNEKEWVFKNVEARYTIALFAFQKKRVEDGAVPLRGPYTNVEEYERGLERGPTWFPVEDAKTWAGSAKFPLLPPVPGAEEALKALTLAPGLSSEGQDWRAVPYREDVAHGEPSGEGEIETDPEAVTDNFWPVFKGASINPPNTELWETDTGKRYAWVDAEAGKKYLQQKRENAYPYSNSPISEMPFEWVEDEDTLPCLYPRVAVRKVARNDDQRTLLASLIPPEVFLNNTLIYFLWPEGGSPADEAYILGILNSIPADWYTRRFVETHLTYKLIKTFPVPRPGMESPLRNRVIELAGRLAGADDRFSDWTNSINMGYGELDEEDQLEKIYELDAVVAHLYGLSPNDLQVIFQTFHDGWDYEPRLNAVLEHYDEWADKLNQQDAEATDD